MNNKFFQPNKALPWKDWIIDKHLQGMNATQIHTNLQKEFPEAADVGVWSVKRLVGKLNPKKNKKSNKSTKNSEESTTKSEEIRLLVKEMISNGIELKCSNIIKTLANRGVIVSHPLVTMAIGQAILKKKLTLAQSTKTILKEDVPCNFDDIANAKEFVDKLGGLEKAISAISAYKKLSTK